MLPPGHAAGGYITGTLMALAMKSDPDEAKALRLLGTIGGLVPDLDLVVHHFARQLLSLEPDNRHHTWITHMFPFYLIPGGLITAWLKRTKRHQLARYSATLTAGICTHLIQDMCGTGDGIQLLYPFNNRMFGVRLLHVHGKEWQRRYVRDPIFLVEIALCLIALFMSTKWVMSSKASKSQGDK
jgi:hypothetical protein